MKLPDPAPRRPGCCPACDAPLGEDAKLVTFRTGDGSLLDATFCPLCAEATFTERRLQYVWERFVLSWLAETRGRVTPWLRAQGERGLKYVIAGAT